VERERVAARGVNEGNRSSAPSSLMSITAMRAPCSAKSTDAARPCPDAAPVMRATLPASSSLRDIAADATGAPAIRQRECAPASAYDPPMSDGAERTGALFEIDGDVATPSELTRGPWDPRAMHGGPPAALLGARSRSAIRVPADFLARITVELLRPVPLVPLTVSARTLRPGKMVHWIEAILRADDVEVARAVGLRLRTVTDSPVAAPPLDAFPGPMQPRSSISIADAARRWLLERQRHRHGDRTFGAAVRRRVAPVEDSARRGRDRDVRATRGRGCRLRERCPATRST